MTTSPIAFLHSGGRFGLCASSDGRSAGETRVLRAMSGTRKSSRLWADKVKFVLRLTGCLVLRTMSMVLAATSEPLVCTKSCISSFWCCPRTSSGPKKCGYVKLLNRIFEYKPGVFQWHSHAKHARAAIEQMGLDVETSKPAPTRGSKDFLAKQDNAGGQLRNAEDELDDEDRSADCSAAGTLLCRSLDRPDIQFSAGRCMSWLSCLVDKLERACQFLEQKAPRKIVAFTDADWASNEDDRR